MLTTGFKRFAKTWDGSTKLLLRKATAVQECDATMPNACASVGHQNVLTNQ